ncbi:MAG: hypothetical protein EOO24_36590 [Comamonadaceae bacterium]|nr:MAG: hypothetical protein EOO24_36590 [Comamonadaceae bacterium]
MSNSLARANDQKKMALCEPCAGVQRNWRRAPGHAELVQTASRKEERPDGPPVNITSYRCDRCGTRWEYENDKANLHAGWSVVGQ